MAGGNIIVEITEDLGTLALVLPADHTKRFVHNGRDVVGFSVSTLFLEQILAELSAARRQMLPSITERWPAGTTVTADRDPKWSIEHDQLAGDPLLHLRDPRFGWAHYILTKDQARKLGHALIAQADAPAPGASGSA
jgi:hypothetical protein